MLMKMLRTKVGKSNVEFTLMDSRLLWSSLENFISPGLGSHSGHLNYSENFHRVLR